MIDLEIKKGIVMSSKNEYINLISLSFFCNIVVFSLYSISPNTKPLITKKVQIASQEAPRSIKQYKQKEWNFIVYMAANNNLFRYALHNFKQLLRIGSTPFVNIILQIDEYGETEVTRFLIQKNNAVIQDKISNALESISGTKESLFDFIEWAITNYPAKHQAIVLWNHGSGIKDPDIWGRLFTNHRNELFLLNDKTGLFEINRYSFQKLLRRGIAFNETHETYINNQDLRECLDRISTEVLDGKKIDIVFMDACHMAMIEYASKLQSSTNFMVASQEIEPAAGYNYTRLLEPFLSQSLSALEFVTHAVSSYAQEYHLSFADFTQSAVNLENIECIEEALSLLVQNVMTLLETDTTYEAMIKKIRKSKNRTTEFFDNDYIDLHHFLTSLKVKIEENNGRCIPDQNREFIDSVLQSISACVEIMQNNIVANSTGFNLPNAQGLSIYFPRKSIHRSYLKTTFARKTNWVEFISLFHKKSRNFF
jgi:hypothetical protein